MKIKLNNAFLFLRKRLLILIMRTFIFLCVTMTFGFSPNPVIASENVNSNLQERINGTVTDTNGQPIPGVNILEKGTNNGVYTDFDGSFSISLLNQNSTLVLSYIGFITKEILVNQNNLTIVLEEDVTGLDEVVVIGYGTARRRDLTGSVNTLKLEEAPVALRPVTSVLQSLQGTIAGVNVGPSNRPGTGPSFVIRGQNSIDGSGDPLVVLDGMVYLGTVNDINPNDIATLDILKDASAAAIYGSRAANGVIMITTKKGKSDKPTIRFNSTLALNTWQNKPDLMNLEQWSDKYLNQLVAQAQRNNQPIPTDFVLSEDVQNSLLAQGIDTDWVDVVSRNSFTLNSQISVSGNSEKTNYYISAGYQDEQGVIVGDEYNRISIRSKLDTNITDWLKIGIDGTYNKNDYSGVGANLSYAYLMPPYAYPYRYENMPENAAANTSRLLERYPMGQSVPNPLWGTDGETRDDVDIRNFFRGAAYAQIKIPGIDGLSYKVNYTINANFNLRDQFYHEDYYVQAQTGFDDPFSRYDEANLANLLSQANGSSLRRNAYRYLIDNIINYKKQFGDHYVDLTAVATRDKTYNKSITVTGNGFSTIGNTILGVDGIPNADNVLTSNTALERTNIGYLGRASYTYKNKYHLSGSIRRDGASVFGNGLKWGTFPSAGVAWTLSNEEFISNSIKSKVNYFKIKASYGTNGNQGLDPYETLAGVISGANGGIRYEFGDNPSEVLYGTVQGNLASPNLGWEETTAFNIGFESAFFNNKVLLNVDYYRSETKDQIFSRQIPIATGFSSILASLGQIDNSGIEISLTTNNIDKEDFKWSSTVNFWQNRNKIAELYGEDLDGDGVEDDDIANRYFVGKPINAIYGYEYDGVVQESDTEYMANTGAQAGDAKYKDLNDDGLIDANNDRKILGYRDPNFSMSLSNTVKYKNFTAYVLITGIFGGGKDNYYVGENPGSNSFQNETTRNEYNIPYWTPENQSEEYLSPIFSDSRYLGLQSRGFVKIQDINLSYNVPSKVINNLNINSLEIYTAINNAFTFTDWFGGGDPEFGNGVEAGSTTYPTPSVYAVGFKLSF